MPRAESELIAGIIAEFRSAIGLLQCSAGQHLVKSGVSMAHVHIMWLLAHHGAMPMSRVAEMLDVSLSNATGLIDRMEERGLVERLRVPDDRRVVLVSLSDRGRRTLEEIELLRGDQIETILARLDFAQLNRLALSLRDVRSALVREPIVGLADPHAHPAPTDAQRPSIRGGLNT